MKQRTTNKYVYFLVILAFGLSAGAKAEYGLEESRNHARHAYEKYLKLKREGRAGREEIRSAYEEWERCAQLRNQQEQQFGQQPYGIYGGPGFGQPSSGGYGYGEIIAPQPNYVPSVPLGTNPLLNGYLGNTGVPLPIQNYGAYPNGQSIQTLPTIPIGSTTGGILPTTGLGTTGTTFPIGSTGTTTLGSGISVLNTSPIGSTGTTTYGSGLTTTPIGTTGTTTLGSGLSTIPVGALGTTPLGTTGTLGTTNTLGSGLTTTQIGSGTTSTSTLGTSLGTVNSGL